MPTRPTEPLATLTLVAVCTVAVASCDDALPAAPGGDRPAVELSDVRIIAPPDAVRDAQRVDTDADADGAPSDASDTRVPGQPLVDIVVQTQQPAMLDTDIRVLAEVTDDPDDTHTYEWSLPAGSGWAIDDPSLQEVLVTPPADTPGAMVDITVVVTDSTGLSATATEPLRVEGTMCGAGESHCIDGNITQCFPVESGVSEECWATSCLAARQVRADEPIESGIYWVSRNQGTDVQQVECDMETHGGGWVKALELDPETGCPGSEWTRVDVGDGTHVCARGAPSGASSHLATFDLGQPWGQLRGRIEVLQYRTPDAFLGSGNLEQIYLDGVSLTLNGQSEHLYSFAVARFESAADVVSGGSVADLCPCAGGPDSPDFVAGDWMCDSAADPAQWGIDTPLFAGDGFDRNCDVRGDLAEFELTRPSMTTSAVEARIMADQGNDAGSNFNEDIGVRHIELWSRPFEGAGNGDDDGDGLEDEVGSTSDNPATSCDQVASEAGWAPSGVYWIDPRNDTAQRVYCNMDIEPGRGWTLAATCRPHDAECFQSGSVGVMTNPQGALSAKLSDEDIRALLDAGDRHALAVFRQKLPDPKTRAVLNTFDMSTSLADIKSNSCGIDGQVFALRSVTQNSVDPTWIEALPADAIAATASSVTTVTDSSGCGCAAGGWINTSAEACGEVAWFNECETGPTLNVDCADGVDQLADVVMWVR